MSQPDSQTPTSQATLPWRTVAAIWVMRGLSVIAAGIAGYLLAVALSQRGLPAGCGAGSGCAEVLSSRWAVILGVPVTAPALALYVAVFIASVFAISRHAAWRSAAWLCLLAAAFALAFSALWFLALQFGVLGSVCPWCIVEHAVGLLLATTIVVGAPVAWRHAPEGAAWGARISPLVFVAGSMLGLFATGLLAGGQVLFESRPAGLMRLPEDRNADTGPGPARQISVLNGSLPLAVHDEPILGDPQAKHLVVILFDYCCPHCRAAHGYLLSGQRKHPGQYAVVLLPMPLDRKCNPHVDETEPRFEHACELARLALAVWRADPAKFAEFDAWMFEPEMPRGPGEARLKAEQLVSPASLASALSDPWIEMTLTRNIAAYHRSDAPRIPVVLSPEFAAIVGRPADEQELLSILERELKLKQ